MKAITKKRIVHHLSESCRLLSLSKHKVNGSTETEKKFHRNRAKHDIIYYILLASKRHVLHLYLVSYLEDDQGIFSLFTKHYVIGRENPYG